MSAAEPDVLRFTATLFSKADKVLLEVPTNISQKLVGMEKVEGMINCQPFRADITLQPNGNYWLCVNIVMLCGSGVSVGEVASLAILGPEPKPIPADDLRHKFDESPAAAAVWDELTQLGKRDWLRWIDDTKNPSTRARRITRTIDQLAQGKRRTCCVNVNGYMLGIVLRDDEKRDAVS